MPKRRSSSATTSTAGGSSKRAKRATSKRGAKAAVGGASASSSSAPRAGRAPVEPKQSKPSVVRAKEAAGLLPAAKADAREEQRSALQRRLQKKASVTAKQSSSTQEAPISPSQIDIHSRSSGTTSAYPVRISAHRSVIGWINMKIDGWQKASQKSEMTASNTHPGVFLFLTVVQVLVVATVCVFGSGVAAVHHASIAALVYGCHALAFFASLVLGTSNHLDATGGASFFLAILWSFFGYEKNDAPGAAAPLHALLAENVLAIRSDWREQVYGLESRKHLVAALSLVWCGRLFFFLVWRIAVRGRDWRFEKFSKGRAYAAFCWCSNATWVWIQGSCIWALNASSAGSAAEVGWYDAVGCVIFAHGILFEHVADAQKSAHNATIRSGSHKAWFAKGLWSISRHPNYFGEILVWLGLGLICMGPAQRDLWHVASCGVSPAWSAVFLISTSLMLLEKRLDRDFGSKKIDRRIKRGYAAYKEAVPVLIPELLPYGHFFGRGYSA